MEGQMTIFDFLLVPKRKATAIGWPKELLLYVPQALKELNLSGDVKDKFFILYGDYTKETLNRIASRCNAIALI